MTTEIERKFLLAELPDAASLGAGEAMRQGYLVDGGDVSVRVRITDRAASLTVKAGGGLSRTEIEFDLSREQADALWPHTEGRRIVKTRYRVPLDAGLTAEVDDYADALSGLLTVEVEFATEFDAGAFTPPPWFGRDVTGEPGWSNSALARHGRPEA